MLVVFPGGIAEHMNRFRKGVECSWEMDVFGYMKSNTSSWFGHVQ